MLDVDRNGFIEMRNVNRLARMPDFDTKPDEWVQLAVAELGDYASREVIPVRSSITDTEKCKGEGVTYKDVSYFFV